LASVITACAAEPTRSPGKPNVIFVLIDTLRADRLSWYTDGSGLTPFLGSLAETSTIYWRAYATSSWTAPSVTSLFTSRYPTQHRVKYLGSSPSMREKTLAALLRGHGYLTAAISAHVLISPGSRFAKGFAFVEHVATQRRAGGSGSVEEVNRATLSWLASRRRDEREKPLFLYLHYMEPHVPFDPPERHLLEVLKRRPSPAAARERAERLRERLLANPFARIAEQDRDAAEDLYDAEVRHLDAGLADLFAQLRRQGLLENAMIVVTADHGEEFFEHGKYGHGQSLYEEVLRVPLLIRTATQDRRFDVHEVVSLIDVAPTLLHGAGISPPSSFEGRSLDLEPTASWIQRSRELFGLTPAAAGFGELYDLTRMPEDAPIPSRAVVTDGA
jgi:arylsulfatase A-like enzyme